MSEGGKGGKEGRREGVKEKKLREGNHPHTFTHKTKKSNVKQQNLHNLRAQAEDSQVSTAGEQRR